MSAHLAGHGHGREANDRGQAKGKRSPKDVSVNQGHDAEGAGNDGGDPQ